MSITVRRMPSITLEIDDDDSIVANIEIDNDGDVTISTDPALSREAAKALAAAIVQACEEYEREVRP